MINKDKNIKDLDIVCEEKPQNLGKEIIEYFPCKAREPYFLDAYPELDYTSLQCDLNNCRNLKIDIISVNDFKKSVRQNGLSFINSLILSNHGIEDVEGNDERKEFVISNLKKKRYCKFNNMRNKDILYFNDNEWKEIDTATCEKYGFIMKKIGVGYLVI